jgi:uncharacterized phage protein (TIGR01671 family)
MRELKFRAWHNKQKKMYSAEELGIDQLTLSVDGRGFVNVHDGNREFSRFYYFMEPMQFTGLHDRNDKEIYEGDILKRTGCLHVFEETPFDIIGKVEWCVGDAGFRFICYTEEHIFVIQTQDEVIGNIHENPDLLKEVQNEHQNT